ncbi:CipA protein [Pseudomassariella vexata]|uniref:CipA protein n=1 Tax=Pseudomassariella vexata TaxID=1141098 RepID=A0A1Y2DYD9_9PEZI|nr:CipA protein [Pseudomassariella vexata]ORY64312.1 CipA protein [Pseudomassariella vexata]
MSSSGNYINKVAIVGATGTVGKFIVEELLKAGNHEVTAITRVDGSSTMPAGVKVAKVDYNNPSTLVDALQGQEALIITMSVRAPKDTQDKLVEAAAVANVPYVLPSDWCPDMTNEEFGNDIFLGPAERATRKNIEDLGKSSWMAIISSFWYEFSLGGGPAMYGLDYKGRSMTFFDDGETKINTITFPQSGRAVANLLALPINSENGPSLSKYKNKFIYVSSFCVSQKDMFNSVLRVTGTKNEDWTINYEDSTKRFEDGKKEMRSGNPLGFRQVLYSRVFFKDGLGNYEATKGLDNGALGLPEEDLDQFTIAAIQLAKSDLDYGE